jgi:hypothetical protein
MTGVKKMAYDLAKIVSYAKKIGNFIKAKPGKACNSWLDYTQQISSCLDRFDSNNLLWQKQQYLGEYARAVEAAAQYLISRREAGTPVMKDRQIYIDEQLNMLKKEYRSVFPQGEIKAPLTKKEPSNNLKFPGIFGAAHQELNREKMKQKGKGSVKMPDDFAAFLRLEVLTSLKIYRDKVLAEDSRDHSFGCIDLQEERKADVLDQFIVDLTALSSMDEVKDFLREFYSEKGKVISIGKQKTWDRSRFDILNTGQNITTRLFSVFGKQTTTINLIDKLAASIGFDPQVTEEMNSRSTKTR